MERKVKSKMNHPIQKIGQAKSIQHQKASYRAESPLACKMDSPKSINHLQCNRFNNEQSSCFNFSNYQWNRFQSLFSVKAA